MVVKKKAAGSEMEPSAAEKMLQLAREIASQTHDWTAVHNRLFGVGGELSRRFPTERERIAFSKTPEYKKIWKLIEELQGDEGAYLRLQKLERTQAASGNPKFPHV